MASTLLVFQNDLRLHDNKALIRVQQSDQPLICLFCIDPKWFKQNRYGLKSVGSARWYFLQQTLEELNNKLLSIGQKLNIIVGTISSVVSDIIKPYDINLIIHSTNFGYYENQEWENLKKAYPGVEFHSADTFTLFDQKQLVNIDIFPSTFSKFRKLANKSLLVPQKLPDIAIKLPPPLQLEYPAKTTLDEINLPSSPKITLLFEGGESKALEHVRHYFSEQYASTYKETRNALDDWYSSCKFSPWLANGALSVREVIAQLGEYEEKHGINESTEWILFELLWREYFQWYSRHFDKKLFLLKGINNKNPLTTFYPQRFKQWCEGKTPWPIVNACMNQLNKTGYLSNRGRQLAASCLINELGLDWRCGAAYFEQQLIDYDVASNWGNWQYIAGVGADPRGGRHFNLEKQTQLYDPDGSFIEKWSEESQVIPISSIDSYDAADWPIEQPSK
jgi:deoxyribodipyrimidine photo-lyase